MVVFYSFYYLQVSEPLRASIKGAPLEDARHLTHRYDRLRQEVEAQVLFDSHLGIFYCAVVVEYRRNGSYVMNIFSLGS